MFVNNGKKEKHCGFCGNKHANECNQDSFNFYKCKCGLTQFMPWDAVAFGGGIQGIQCGCGNEAQECWEGITYEEYQRLEFEKELMEAVKAVDEGGLTEHQYQAVTKLLGIFMNEHSKAVKAVQVINAQSEIMLLKPVKH